MGQLSNKKIAILATDGVEESEFKQPLETLQKAGAEIDVISIKEGKIRSFNHFEESTGYDIDKTVEQANASDYHALVLPGGVHNPDALRTDETAIKFVRDVYGADKPVAAICHGPWVLVEAGLCKDRTLTSWPSLRTDIKNAGGEWVDQEVCVDRGLITSRNPDDLDAFCKAIIKAL